MEYSEEKKGKLGRLEKKLYSRNAPNIIDQGRSEINADFQSTPSVLKEDWEQTTVGSFDKLAAKVSSLGQTRQNFVKKIFIGSLIFFVLAAVVAGLVFWGGMNLVSSRNVDIQVDGPLSVGGGQEISFDINVINGNNVDLDSAALIVEYPEGTRSTSDLSQRLDRERFELETIKSGESYRQNVKAVFFGEKDSTREIKISLEYRVENSSALFYKEKVHEISISSAPLIITPTYPKEVNSNQDISFNIEIASNSKDKMGNFLVNVEYPFGFVFKGATPTPSFGENIWSFSGLNPGEKKTIVVRGSVVGQDNEEKVFKINAGTPNKDDERMIAVPLSELTESVLVKKPFVGVDVAINGRSGDVVTRGGERINVDLAFRNNLPSKIFNASITVLLKGDAFNRLNVSTQNNGFFQSSDDSILWDKRSIPTLESVGPGIQIPVSFSLAPFSYSDIQSSSKPEVEMTVKINGERTLESGSVEKVEAIEKRKITLGTDLSVSAVTVRSMGDIENSGPIPPKVNVPTTYTVLWSINNSFNQVSNVEVRAILPSYVKWTGEFNPKSESISFNSVTNEVVWNAGAVLPNTGFNSPSKKVYFQLQFLPSTSQIGGAPPILGGTSVSGVDKATNLRISSQAPAVTTYFSGDPSYKKGDELVVP